jgi:hypothetical protein
VQGYQRSKLPRLPKKEKTPQPDSGSAEANCTVLRLHAVLYVRCTPACLHIGAHRRSTSSTAPDGPPVPPRQLACGQTQGVFVFLSLLFTCCFLPVFIGPIFPVLHLRVVCRLSSSAATVALPAGGWQSGAGRHDLMHARTHRRPASPQQQQQRASWPRRSPPLSVACRVCCVCTVFRVCPHVCEELNAIVRPAWGLYCRSTASRPATRRPPP